MYLEKIACASLKLSGKNTHFLHSLVVIRVLCMKTGSVFLLRISCALGFQSTVEFFCLQYSLSDCAVPKNVSIFMQYSL